MSSDRSGAVAGVISEAKGWPSATVAMLAARLARSSWMAAHASGFTLGNFTLSGTSSLLCATILG